MHSNDSFLDYTFSNNRQAPMSSYATQWQTNRSHQDLHHQSFTKQTLGNKNVLEPKFLSLMNKHSKIDIQQKEPQSNRKKQENNGFLSIFDNLCKCVQIQKEANIQISKIKQPSRVDLRHLVKITKQTQPQQIKSQKRTLTPINSLVNLLEERK